MQRVNWTKQAMLAGGLLALGSAAYWLEYKHKPEKESKEEQTKKVFDIKDKAVTEIRIHDGAGHLFAVRCSDDASKLCKPGDNSKWELTTPLKIKADDANANALLSTLNNLSVNESIDLKEESPEKRATLLKEYGLDANARSLPGTKRVAVSTAAGTTVLFLGSQHPIGDSIFGIIETAPAGQQPTGKAAEGGVPGVNENKVVLVPTFFKTNFDHDLTYWRDKKVLTIGVHEIGSFQLKAPRVQASGVRKDGQWTLKSPSAGEFTGDLENVDSILTAATFLTAKDFASDSKADAKGKAALQGARSVVTLEMQPNKSEKDANPAPVTLTLYQKGELKPPPGKKTGSVGKLYATVSNLDPVYELDHTSLARFDKSLKDLRLAKLITSMERFTTKKIEFSGKPVGGSPLKLVDKDGKWSIEGGPASIASDRPQAVLEKLSGNRIQEFIPAASAPKGEAEGLTVKLSDEKDAVKRQLVFWKSKNDLYARDLVSQRKEVFRVDSAVAEALPWSRDFFEKKPEPAPAAPAGGPGAPVPPPHGHGDGHGHGHGPGDGHGHGMPGAPPEPGKALVPQPEKKNP
jgi:hypothetical protein